MAQLDNAADSDSEERGFKSLQAGQRNKDLLRQVLIFLCLCPQGHNIVLSEAKTSFDRLRSTSFYYKRTQNEIASRRKQCYTLRCKRCDALDQRCYGLAVNTWTLSKDIALRAKEWYNKPEVIEMKEDKLSDLSMQLSVDVLNLVKELRSKKETIISNQIGRSATSVCANIAESKYGHSRADFIAKLEIALKEASETGKWLEMLYKTNYINEAIYKKINKTCSTIRILLIASIKTAKGNNK